MNFPAYPPYLSRRWEVIFSNDYLNQTSGRHCWECILKTPMMSGDISHSTMGFRLFQLLRFFVTWLFVSCYVHVGLFCVLVYRPAYISAILRFRVWLTSASGIFHWLMLFQMAGDWSIEWVYKCCEPVGFPATTVFTIIYYSCLTYCYDVK